MSKLSSIVALFAVVLLVADAYAYRTTVTTVEVDEDNQGRQERCRHIRPREQLRNCENFLRQQGGGRREIMENQWGREQGLEECCRQLRNVEEHCRCDALEEVAREVQSQQHGQQGSHILQQARILPSMCQLHPQRCDF
ncbi:2S albumin-like [Momordica charantia]|uniref:2S albumin-like n=1 Tax=Momordica charantia TaxID=3673 RepID=A0A6J1DQ97_MOMCH|nr:2S albumin-like [Momordica charantia]